jgi:hypothetical protein
MSVIPVDKSPGARNVTSNSRRFWRRLRQTVDAYFADRSRRAVSMATRRRAKHELDHCRRLLQQSALPATVASGSNRRFVRT